MTTRIALDFSTDIDWEPWRMGVCDNCHGDHHIQQCPQIARFDIETHLREQLATCHEAIGAALALVRQQSYGAAEIVLEHAMKGTRMYAPDPPPPPDPPIDIPDEPQPPTPGGPEPPEWGAAMGGGVV